MASIDKNKSNLSNAMILPLKQLMLQLIRIGDLLFANF